LTTLAFPLEEAWPEHHEERIMKYNQPYGAPGSNDPYVNGDPSIGRAGSIPPAESIEYPQREIVNVISDTSYAVPSNSDLHQLGKAIQSGLLNYKDDTGIVNVYSCNMTPAPTAYAAGLFVILKIAHDNTGDSVLNLNSLGNKQIIHRDGSAISGGELKTGGIYAFYYDGTKFQLVWSTSVAGAGIVYLVAPRTFYVNFATGLDTNDGTSATFVSGVTGPFKTLQRAADEATKYNLNGFNITINVADSTSYTSVFMKPVVGSGNVIWQGNNSTPANVTVSASGAEQVAIGVGGVTHVVNGFKVTSSNGPGIGVGSNSLLVLGNIEWGLCKGAQTQVVYGATLRYNGTAYRITGGAASGGASPASWLWAYQGSIVEIGSLGAPPSLTLVGAIDFSTGGGFIVASMLSTTTVFFSSISGSATGTRARVGENSIINSGGGGVNYYPGNSVVVGSSGGQYL
jgi:hypothetical protein